MPLMVQAAPVTASLRSWPVKLWVFVVVAPKAMVQVQSGFMAVLPHLTPGKPLAPSLLQVVPGDLGIGFCVPATAFAVVKGICAAAESRAAAFLDVRAVNGTTYAGNRIITVLAGKSLGNRAGRAKGDGAGPVRVHGGVAALNARQAVVPVLAAGRARNFGIGICVPANTFAVGKGISATEGRAAAFLDVSAVNGATDGDDRVIAVLARKAIGNP